MMLALWMVGSALLFFVIAVVAYVEHVRYVARFERENEPYCGKHEDAL